MTNFTIQPGDEPVADLRPENRTELVFALVGAAGSRLEDLAAALKEYLASFGYQFIDIRLSELLDKFTWDPQQGTTDFDRIRHLQDKGDAFRDRLKDGAALARAAIAKIRQSRADHSGSPDTPAAAHAYILRQLKHPDEVELLRRVYGASFYLIAGHAPRDQRIKELASRMARKDAQSGQEARFEASAIKIIEVDEKQESDFGQNTRDTYPKADFFANLATPSGKYGVHRFIDLIFGHPFRTPQPEEYAMYQASAASLRSSDDNRQVGAVIVRLTTDLDGTPKNVDVIAEGMNEVPRGGGGFYWDGNSPDFRDQALLVQNIDRAADIKISALAELIERINQKQWLRESLAGQTPSALARELLPNLRRTQFMNIGEFSRPVHAEMAAIIDAARRGVAVDGHTMYVTTFPCHNCAKHIIATGIRKVVYIEPYPKSRAINLHGEEMVVESADGKLQEGKVVFFPYSGIAPRQYRRLFSISERDPAEKQSQQEWRDKHQTLWPRYVLPNAALVYIREERSQLERLPTDIYQWDKALLSPPLPPDVKPDRDPQTDN
jgi:cytidine deaminase